MKYIHPCPRGPNFLTCQMTDSSLNLLTTQCGNMLTDKNIMKTHRRNIPMCPRAANFLLRKCTRHLTMSISRDIICCGHNVRTLGSRQCK